MYSRYQPFEPLENLLHSAAHPAPPLPGASPARAMSREALPPAERQEARVASHKKGFGGLLSGLKLDLDSGDILLLLILLFLSQEGDDMETVVLLGLVLLLGL